MQIFGGGGVVTRVAVGRSWLEIGRKEGEEVGEFFSRTKRDQKGSSHLGQQKAIREMLFLGVRIGEYTTPLRRNSSQSLPPNMENAHHTSLSQLLTAYFPVFG